MRANAVPKMERLSRRSLAGYRVVQIVQKVDEDVRWSVVPMTRPWGRAPSNTAIATAVNQAGKLQLDKTRHDSIKMVPSA